MRPIAARRPRTAAFVLAAALAFALAADLLWMPVQVFDSLDEILNAQASPSVWASFEGSLRSDNYHLRPLRIAQTKILYDLAGGEHYWLVYRGFHAALLVAAVLLFTAAQRVSSGVDLAASAFALAVLVGLRSFRGGVQEAFPVNHFLEIVVLCLLTLNLARSRGGWWADVGAVLALVAAALTLESGLLVWIVAVGAWAVGWRGISMRGIAAMTALVAGYAYLRFVHLATGVPYLPDRSTGFLFTVLDPPELQERFGDLPAMLYAYNVVAAAFSVLFSEPASGVFVTVRAWLSGDVPPRLAIAVITSTATTIAIAWAAVRRLGRPWRLDDTGRFIVLLAIVLAANAAVSYAYTKDEIMGVAGAFYALAAFAAMREILHRLAGRAERAQQTQPTRQGRGSVDGGVGASAWLVLIVSAAVLTAAWSVRAAGIHYLLRTQAYRHQNDWVHMPGTWQRNGKWPADPAAQQLIRQLHDAAVGAEVPNTRVGEPRWVERLWED